MMSTEVFSQYATPLVGKRVRIAGEDFVVKGILIKVTANLDKWADHRFKALLQTESGEHFVEFDILGNMTLDEEQKEIPATQPKLDTIQRRENLNEVYRCGETGPGGAYHDYEILRVDNGLNVYLSHIAFQKGPRKDPNARHGVTDQDLLEIVRDRLLAFSNGEMTDPHTERALSHVEAALFHLNQRIEDRIARGVLGTMEK